MENEREMLKLLKWLSKAIITINWFNGGLQAGIIIAKHMNECKCVEHTSYDRYYKTSEHA